MGEKIWRKSNPVGGGLHKGRVKTELRTVEEGGEFGEAKRQALRRGGAEGNMAELAARPGNFPVEVEMRVGDRQDFGGLGKVANQI